MILRIVFISAVVLLSACAKQPDAIAAVDVGPDFYSAYSCTQLTKERLKTAQDLENLSAEQKSAANNDALGVLVLGLPISSMSGSDKEAAIAIAKGKIQAIDRQKLAKRCR